MKQKIFLGILVMSIFFTYFSVNVSASEEETTKTLTMVETSEELSEIQTIYNSYIITQYDGSGKYIVFANIHPQYIDGSTIKTGAPTGLRFTCLCAGAYDTIEEAKQGVINGGLTESEVYKLHDMTLNYSNYLYYSSHDIYV